MITPQEEITKSPLQEEIREYTFKFLNFSGDKRNGIIIITFKGISDIDEILPKISNRIKATIKYTYWKKVQKKWFLCKPYYIPLYKFKHRSLSPFLDDINIEIFDFKMCLSIDNSFIARCESDSQLDVE